MVCSRLLVVLVMLAGLQDPSSTSQSLVNYSYSNPWCPTFLTHIQRPLVQPSSECKRIPNSYSHHCLAFVWNPGSTLPTNTKARFKSWKDLCSDLWALETCPSPQKKHRPSLTQLASRTSSTHLGGEACDVFVWRGTLGILNHGDMVLSVF